MHARRAQPPKPPKGAKATPLERRAAALQKAKDTFGPKRFSMRHGRDCGQLVAFHLARLGRKLNIGSAGSYKDPAGARRALKRLGFASLPEACDALLERIPYSRMVIGDILQLPAEEGEFADLGALAIYMGDGAIYGYHSDAERPVSMKMEVAPVACWSAL